jgi:hypothetical protein
METTKALTQIKLDAIDKFRDAVVAHGDAITAPGVDTATFLDGHDVFIEMWNMIRKLRAEVRATEKAELEAYSEDFERRYGTEEDCRETAAAEAYAEGGPGWQIDPEWSAERQLAARILKREDALNHRRGCLCQVCDDIADAAIYGRQEEK